MATRKRVSKKPVKRPKGRRTTKEPVLTKLDFWAIAANEVYMACRKSGMDEGTALAFAMDRSSYPDWIVDTKRPIKQKFSKTPEKNRISDAANLVILSIFYFMTFYKGVILLL